MLNSIEIHAEVDQVNMVHEAQAMALDRRRRTSHEHLSETYNSIARDDVGERVFQIRAASV